MERVCVILAAAVVGILLQIFLSGQEKRWPGLVLPGICAACSLLLVCSLVAVGSTAEMAAAIMLVLTAGNLPTLVLLAIYAVCRGMRRRHREVEKMTIEDL